MTRMESDDALPIAPGLNALAPPAMACSDRGERAAKQDGLGATHMCLSRVSYPAFAPGRPCGGVLSLSQHCMHEQPLFRGRWRVWQESL